MTHLASQPIQVAINGGGLAGAILARSLLRYSQLEIRVYESAATFSERGAAVGLSFNALRSLKMIDPKLFKVVYEAGGVESNATKILIGDGPNKGQLIEEIAPFMNDANRQKTMIVSRAQLLQELVKAIPENVMHANKKLNSIAESATPLKSHQPRLALRFEDGSIEYADAVIGADGIHSCVRGHVLGKNHPATLPIYAGWWDCRNLVPISRGVEKIGTQYVNPSDPHQHDWIGHGGFLLHDILQNGEVLQCVAAVRDVTNEDPEQWKRPLTRKELDDKFRTWQVGPGMVDLLADQDGLTAFSEWEHRDAPTFVKGAVCIIGDAAHAMTPWQGAGAGQAIEDVLVLQSLLGQVTQAAQVGEAFRAYDQVRRPRAQQVAASSTRTGMIFTGQDETVGMDPKELRDTLHARWKFIHEVDLEKMVRDASDAFRAEC